MALTGTMGIAAPLFVPLAISAGSVAGLALASVAGFAHNHHKLIAQYRSVDHHHPGTEGPPSESDFEPQATKSDLSKNEENNKVEQRIEPLTPTFFKSDEELEQLIKEGIPEKVYREPQSSAFLRNHPEKAFEFYTRAAACGHLQGIYDLGFCYLVGKGTESDLKKAAEHFERAATQGHVAAQYYLGELYWRNGGPENWPLALKWLKEASESKDTLYSGRAAESIGDYFNTDHNSKNFAIEWYEKAIAHYLLSSLNSASIGSCYEKMAKFDLAAQWYQASFDQGNRHVSYQLGLCYQQVEKFELAIEYLKKASCGLGIGGFSP